jgi:tRNA(fMet)-specific endonuclease VapC
MTYLVDTDWVILGLNGRAEALTLLTDLAPEGLAISLITYAEIYEGIYYGRDPKRHESGFRAFLRNVDVLPPNKQIMKRFAQV